MIKHMVQCLLLTEPHQVVLLCLSLSATVSLPSASDQSSLTHSLHMATPFSMKISINKWTSTLHNHLGPDLLRMERRAEHKPFESAADCHVCHVRIGGGVIFPVMSNLNTFTLVLHLSTRPCSGY